MESACPLEYRYGAAAFRSARTDRVHTAYIVGGLYGNTQALNAIEHMQAAEAKAGTRVSLVFNGDFNWFDTDADSFQRVNTAALNGLSIRGNVEAEMTSALDEGCGCNYPDYVNAEYAERSNAIMRLLRARARQHPNLCAQIDQLPFIRVLLIGNSRIGVVHGDAQSLSGWDFAAERLSPIGKCCSGDAATTTLTPETLIEDVFRRADVHAFASTHTCLPHAKDYTVDGIDRLIVNNGAAGMPNFQGTDFGLITRISENPAPPPDSLYGINLNGLRYDALPVRFDTERWMTTFLNNWPVGTPAHDAYYQRIVNGPDFRLEDATAGRVQRLAAI